MRAGGPGAGRSRPPLSGPPPRGTAKGTDSHPAQDTAAVPDNPGEQRKDTGSERLVTKRHTGGQETWGAALSVSQTHSP